MIELRLHLELYARSAIDDAVERFSSFGELEQLDEAPYRVVRVRAATPERERAIAGELANFALGNSIGAERAADDPGAPPSREPPSGSRSDEPAQQGGEP
jgi:hypothetical protein